MRKGLLIVSATEPTAATVVFLVADSDKAPAAPSRPPVSAGDGRRRTPERS